MTPSQIDNIRESFALVRPISDQAGTIFYDKLFELDPTLRGMFKTDIREQSKKLMQMLATVVSSLDRMSWFRQSRGLASVMSNIR